MNFNPKILGFSVGIFRNFWDCFQTIRAEFSGLFLDNPDMIFGTVFRQSRTGLRFGFNPVTDRVFRYHINLLMNGTKNG